MKKILPVLAIMLAVVALSSCNPMERKAKRQLHDTMKELAKNPETFKISNAKIVFSPDRIWRLPLYKDGVHPGQGRI